MLLNQIKKPTLQEALGLEWVFDLHEILNTRFDDEAWEQLGNKQVGTAKLGEETFQLYLEPGTFPIDGIKYRFINVAFAKLIDGKPSEDLQWNSKNASAVVGAITHALLDRVALYDYDAVVFVANGEHAKKRMTIYNQVARRKWSSAGLGVCVENQKVENGLITILLSKALAKEPLDAFYAHLSKLKK
jgi:hypothetical protein